MTLGSMLGGFRMNSISELLNTCKEVTNELNDRLLDLLNNLDNNDEVEELYEFCDGLTKWSDFISIESILENLDKEEV